MRREGSVPMSGHLVQRALMGSRVPRQVQQQLNQIEHDALVQVTRVAAVGFVTQSAMFQVANLTNLEAELIKAAPLAERRLDAIVNTATALIAAEMSQPVF